MSPYCGIIAVATSLCKEFIRDKRLLARQAHHAFGEDELLPPVEIGLKEANCLQLVDEVITTDLLEEDGDADAPT